MCAPINRDSERRLGHAGELRHGVLVLSRSRAPRALKSAEKQCRLFTSILILFDKILSLRD